MAKAPSMNPSVVNLDSLLTNENYKEYHKLKTELRKKYDDRLFNYSVGDRWKKTINWYKEEGQEQYRNYLKELADIMFQPDSHYQRFTWDLISEQEQLIMRRKIKPRVGKGEY